MPDFLKALTEAGVTVKRSDFILLSEEAKIKVADNVLTEMFKFVTDKYNALDFSEIERSAGDVRKFKYRNLVLENTEILENIYMNSSDQGAKKYLEVIEATRMVYDFLDAGRDKITHLYKTGNGVIQLMYTSLVAATIYGVSALITNTIRFVTTEVDSEMEVVFDEVPGSIRQIHIKNLLSFKNDRDAFIKLVDSMYKDSKKSVNESIELASVLAAGAVVAGVIYLIPKFITLIREFIYSFYYSRVKLENALELQISLIRTNIESLEAGRGNKKVIVRQKKIAERLEHLKNKISVKLDTAEALSKVQQKKENSTLRIEKGSPLMNTEPASNSGLMI